MSYPQSLISFYRKLTTDVHPVGVGSILNEEWEREPNGPLRGGIERT